MVMASTGTYGLFRFLSCLSCLAEPNTVLLSTATSQGEKHIPSPVDFECHSRRVSSIFCHRRGNIIDPTHFWSCWDVGRSEDCVVEEVSCCGEAGLWRKSSKAAIGEVIVGFQECWGSFNPWEISYTQSLSFHLQKLRHSPSDSAVIWRAAFN